MQVALALLLIVQTGTGTAAADLVRTRAANLSSSTSDWPAGTVEEQLDRDPTLIPFGKGALFVPAMTDPLDEPPVTIRKGTRRVAEATSGARIVLWPGTYTVEIGSGADDRMSFQATVREQQVTVIPVSWAGLSVHVIDEQLGSVRGSYEIIRVENRSYVGLGFGTDEQAGEPVSTWILRPGLYKIVRVGQNYRARRDFATVRLTEAHHTHFQLVVDPETGNFIGGGEVPREELFSYREDFFWTLVLGGDLSMNDRRKVPALPDGTTFNVRGFLDGRFSISIYENPFVLQMQVEEGQTKGPDLPWQKSDDRADIDGLYIYALEPWLGPYVRFGAETNLLPGDRLFSPEPADVRLFDENGNLISEQLQVDRVRLSPALGLFSIKEGVGLNARVFKTFFAEASVRSGFGARHVIARDVFQLDDDELTPQIEYRAIPSNSRLGVEATVLGRGRISRWVLLNVELDTLLPFRETSKDAILELETSVAVKITSYLSLNYILRFVRDRVIQDEDRLEQDIVVRFSVELF